MKNLGGLKNEIAKMKCGDIITITFMYKNNNSEDMDEIITELAKTRWMDSYTYLLGGTCDEVIGLQASDPDDLSEDELLKEAQLVVDKIIEIKEPDDIVFSNDGYRVEIHAYGGCLRSCEMDNMVYHK